MNFVLNWGILSTGWISGKFVKDLMVHPSTRDVNDIEHNITAVASRSEETAIKFIKEHKLPQHVLAYGSYEELVKDSNVNVVYIGTPHSRHYEDARLCLLAGKNVLLEKPACVNAAQAEALSKLAKKNKLFLMEAVWTRFFSTAQVVRSVIDDDILGHIKHVSSEYVMDNGCDDLPETDRLLSPDTAGGSLLDLGPYAWLWIALTLVRPKTPVYGDRPYPVPEITSTVAPIAFSSASREQGMAPATATFHTSFTYLPAENHPAVTVHGTKGVMTIAYPPSNPRNVRVELYETRRRPDFVPLIKQNATVKDYPCTVPGGARGFIWEQDEVARCIRDGKLESEFMPHQETVLMMKVFDEIRRQNNMKFPDEIERL